MSAGATRWAPGELESLLGRAGMVVVRWRAERGWPIDRATPGLQRFGCPTEESAMGRPSYARIVHPDDRARIEAELDDLVRSNRDLAVQELRLLCPPGEVRWIEQRACPRLVAAGRATHFEGVLLDVTRRHAEEEATRRELLALRRLLDAIPVPVFYKDADLVYRDCNTAFQRMLGLAATEIVGATVHDVSPEEFARTYDMMDRTLLASRGVQTYEAQVRFANGTRHDIVFHKAVVVDDSGLVGGIVGAMLDVTERNQAMAALRQARERLEDRVRERTEKLTLANRRLEDEIAERRVAERQLQESEARYRRIVETAAEGIVVLGPDAFITLANDRMTEMLGYRSEEMVGKLLTDFMFEEDAPAHLEWMAARRQGPTRQHERRFRRKDGQTVWTRASATPILDEQQRFGGSFAMYTDITERKKAERALEEERRLFIAGQCVAFKWKNAEGWPVEYVSPNVTQRFGYAPADFTSGRLAYASIVHPDDLARVAEEVRAYSESRTPYFEQEYRIARADGEYRWVHDFTVVVRDATGALTHYHGYVTDVTERKQDAETLRRTNRELRALSKCNQALIRAEDEQTLLNDVCCIICDAGGYRAAWVEYGEQDGAGSVRPVAWAGEADHASLPRGPAEIVIRGGDVLVVHDIATDPRMAPWHESALQMGFRSGIGLPLRDESSKVFGALLVFSVTPSFMTPDEIRLMEELAGDLAFGIEILRARNARKRVERNLALLTFALDHTHEAAFLIDESARLLYVNEEACRVLGYGRDELLALTVPDIDADFPSERWPTHWAELKARGALTFEGRHRAKDGHILPVEISATFFEYGGQAYNLALVRDITERTLARREREQLLEDVQEERSRLRVVLDTAPVGICLHLAPDGRLALSNKAAEAILGCAADMSVAERVALLGARLPNGEPLPPESLPLSRSLRGESLTGFEMVIHQPSGGQAHILENTAPVRDADGRVVGAVVAFHDVTPMKEQERQRDEFIAAVAHELKTPVTTIRGYVEMLRRWMPEERKAHEARAIDALLAQTHRINRRVQEMLEVARFRRAPVVLLATRFDLGELAGDVVERTQAMRKMHRVSLRREGPVPVAADRERLEEVLVNLLDNAIESSPEGGDIEVRVWREGDEALAAVRDHGVGIASVRQPHVFEPFYEAVPPGAPGYRSVVPLVLYLSKLIIDRHRGRIWLESEEGKGSTFCFSLAAATGEVDGR